MALLHSFKTTTIQRGNYSLISSMIITVLKLALCVACPCRLAAVDPYIREHTTIIGERIESLIVSVLRNGEY